jgi:hypothetical protein
MQGAQGEQLQQLSQQPETLLAGTQVATHSHNLAGSDWKGQEANWLLFLLLLLLICVLLVDLALQELLVPLTVLTSRAERSLRHGGGKVAGAVEACYPVLSVYLWWCLRCLGGLLR